MKKPKNGLKSNKDSPDYKLIPNSKKYHTQKQGKMNMRFESQTGRKENILLQSPFPGDKRFQVLDAHDQRFELTPIKFERFSNYERSVSGPKMSTVSARPDFVSSKAKNLDFNSYQNESFMD